MANTAKRRRELARARWERQQQRRSATAHRRRLVAKVAGVLVAVVAVAGGIVLVAGAFDDDEPTTDPAAGDQAACEYRDTGDAAVPGIGLPPALGDSASLPSAATITLNGAPVEVELLSDAAPCTVNSFAFLAGAGYFDATACHRLTTSDTLKVLQCGDPTGNDGSPGYEFDNENTDGATYPAGTLAMANGGADTNGSQFFLVYGDSQLSPDYTVFGRVTTGLEVLTGIAAAGTADGSPDAAPKTPVTLTTVTTT